MSGQQIREQKRQVNHADLRYEISKYGRGNNCHGQGSGLYLLSQRSLTAKLAGRKNFTLPAPVAVFGQIVGKILKANMLAMKRRRHMSDLNHRPSENIASAKNQAGQNKN